MIELQRTSKSFYNFSHFHCFHKRIIDFYCTCLGCSPLFRSLFSKSNLDRINNLHKLYSIINLVKSNMGLLTIPQKWDEKRIVCMHLFLSLIFLVQSKVMRNHLFFEQRRLISQIWRRLLELRHLGYDELYLAGSSV